MEEEAREERLKLIQDMRVYPVGRVLRETFDAANHDTLGSDVTGLMINLSRVPFEADALHGERPVPVPAASKAASPMPKPPGLLHRIGALLRGR